MKHIKTFENWTTNQTDDYNINYGDEPKIKKQKISQEVLDIIDYIDNNVDNVNSCYYHYNEGYVISFLKNDHKIKKILSYHTSNLSHIDIIEITGIHYTEETRHRIFTTKKEHKEFLKLFYKIQKDMYNNSNISNIIDPVKRSANKFNL